MRETFGLNEYKFTRGKWIILIASVAMMVIGMLLAATSKEQTASLDASTAVSRPNDIVPDTPASPAADGMMNTFADDGGFSLPIPGLTNGFPDIPEPASTPPDTMTDPNLGSRDFSTLFVKGGFGLFMGFAIGFAVRAFIKLATVIIGFYFLTLIMMSYMGWIEIHWHIIEGQFDGLVSNLGAQFQSFKAFLTGGIPSGGAAATGLAMGLRKQ